MVVKHDATQIARTPLLLLDCAERRGMNRAELMREAGLSDDSLADPDHRLPVANMRRLWKAVIERDPDPNLGLFVGTELTAKRMGLVGYAMYFSDDLFEAMMQLARYSRLISDAVSFRVNYHADTTLVRSNLRPYMIAQQHPVVAALATLVTVSREITETALEPRRVNVPILQPANSDEYVRLFGAGVRFEAEEASVEFSNEQITLPVVAHDPSLRSYLNELADVKVRSLGENDTKLVDTVRRGIWSSMQHGRPNLQSVASIIGMSPRTLQRRLGEHDVSFQALLDDLRFELSEELRSGRGYSATETAFLLGYSEPSAYQRAQRRWRQGT
jgi:AraC-like DNA-binding protein